MKEVAKLIDDLGADANRVFRAVKPNPKRPYRTKRGDINLSSVRYGLIVEGTTLASQVQRVYDHYAKNGDIELALKEAAKVKDDATEKWDLGRGFYKLVKP